MSITQDNLLTSEPIRKEVESLETDVIRCLRLIDSRVTRWRGRRNTDVRRIGVGCATRAI